MWQDFNFTSPSL
jgi:hypothetical protein